MKTKNLILSILMLPILLNACGILTVRGSGNVLTESRDVHDFDRVVISGIDQVLLVQGGDESLAVTADDNLMRYIESEVRDGTLYIGPLQNREELSPSQPILLELSVKEIVALELSGIVTAKTGDLVTGRLDLDVSGMSTLQMGSLETQKLTVHLSGSTKVEMTGPGEAVEQKIVMNGSNTYYAPRLLSQSVGINASGPNDVTVWAADFLNIDTSGIGNVDYYGSPQVTQSGSGNININGLGNP